MHPPRAKPSKNWWKESAATSGLIVQGLRETPSDRPMMTECDTIPISSIYTSCKISTRNALLKHLLSVSESNEEMKYL
jgi:hypothetical protein